MSQPTPAYTWPYLWPETLIEWTWARRKSHSTSGFVKGTTNPPLAASTWIGTWYPVCVSSCSSKELMVLISHNTPLYVLPRIDTTPIVFSSTSETKASGLPTNLSESTETSLSSTSKSFAHFFRLCVLWIQEYLSCSKKRRLRDSKWRTIDVDCIIIERKAKKVCTEAYAYALCYVVMCAHQMRCNWHNNVRVLDRPA